MDGDARVPRRPALERATPRSPVHAVHAVHGIVGLLALGAGLAALLVPLQHAGPYGLPGRGLVGGVGGLAIAALLLVPRVPALARGLALLLSPAVLFLALYGALAEFEEVVVLYAGESGEVPLRLWIVDHEGGEWVSMPRAKAEGNGVDGARLERLRGGELRCVVPRLMDDPTAARRTFDLRQEKYAVQRLGGRVGLFGDGPAPDIVTLRLDPCE